MALETVTHISDLVATNPASSDPKSQGDDHIRNIKSALKADFPGFTGTVLVGGTDTGAANAYVLSAAMPAYVTNTMVVWKPSNANTGAATININSLGVRNIKRSDGSALVAGDIPASQYVAIVDNGSEYRILGVTKNYIDQLAFSTAFPNQTGNADKITTTDGTSVSWTDLLKVGTIKLADSTDTTKRADFSLSGITTGNTRTMTVPDRSGTVHLEGKGADIASAGTVNLDTATGDFVHITGTTTITAITLASGIERTVVFDGALTLTHNATTLILPGGANITTAAGDRAIFRGDGVGNARCISYTRADGLPVISSPAGITLLATSSVSSPVATVDFTSVINSTYDDYLIVGSNIVPATNGSLLNMTVSENGGSSWAAASYAYALVYADTAASPSGASSSSTSAIQITNSIGNTSGRGAGFSVTLRKPSGTTTHKFMHVTSECEDNSGVLTSLSGSATYRASLNAINAVRFAMNSGNISAGEFKLYGLRKTV